MSNKMIVTNTKGLREFLSRTFNKDVGSTDALYIAERIQDFLSPASPTPLPNDLYEGMRMLKASYAIIAIQSIAITVLLIAYFMK